jgi:hypothetical protein
VDQDKSRGISLVKRDVKADVKEKRRAVDDRMTASPVRQAFNATDDGRPEGHLKRYTRSGKAVILTDGTYQSFNQSDTMDIVYGLDGTTVYLKNILYGSNVKFGDYWVQGQLSADGTQITVPMGQRIYHSSSPVINVVLAWGRSSYTVHGTSSRFSFEVNEDVTEAVYLIDGNTITLQDSFTTLGSSYPGFEGTGLGCMGRSGTSDPIFAGFFEWNTVLTFASFTPHLITEIPDNCTVHMYKRNSASIYMTLVGVSMDLTDGVFKVAFDRANLDVFACLRDHLGLLYGADPVAGIKHKNADAGDIPKTLERGFTGISAGGGEDEDIVPVAALFGGAFHQVGQQTQRHIFKC